MPKANITFTHKMDSPRRLKVYVEAEGHIVHDIYGADAEGNRGVLRGHINGLEIIVRDARSNDITAKVKKSYPIEYHDILERAEDRLWDLLS